MIPRYFSKTILTLAVISAVILQAQETLTNASILKLVKSGLSEAVIVSLINQQPGAYTLSVDDLVSLKQNGVSDKIVAAMVTRNSGGGGTTAGADTTSTAASGAAPAASVAPATREIGVYFKKGDTWEEVLPEVVNWKTGGTIKNLASVGVVKKDLNGNIAGPGSRNSVKNPMEFLVVAAEGVSITEYQLIRLRLNKDYREFRTVTGGILNQQSGAMRDLVPFEGKKISPRTFSVVLPANLGSGQYGFLAPGAMGSSGNSQAQIGKMYTFHLVE